MRWQRIRDLDSPWATKSEDGYYAIATPLEGQFEAFHIEALWARPLSIGTRSSLDLAKEFCEHHSAQPRTNNP